MLLKFLSELVGTFILILLGDGVVANVTLNKSGMKGGGTVQITLAWGLAVMVPAFIFGAASGAHFNPALTLALAVEGVLRGQKYRFISSGSLRERFWAPAAYTFCSKDSLMPRKIQTRNEAYSVHRLPFRTKPLTCSQRLWLHSCWYLPLRGSDRCPALRAA